MPRAFWKKEKEPEEPKKPTLYTLKLEPDQAEQLHTILQHNARFAPYEVDYASFAYKADKVNVVFYTSGKLVVQGKGTEEFVQHTLEAEVTGDPRLGYDEIHHPEWFEPHGGLDESGKGDLFGPLVSACVIADGEMVRQWREKGLQDSKKMTEASILRLEKIIRGTKGVVIKTTFAGMPKYNEMMAKPGNNVNKYLAWLHSRSLLEALSEKRVPWALLDQFSKQPLTQRIVAKDDREIDLRMRTKAEDDPVVAAASVIASATFTKQLGKLSEAAGEKLKKGASAAVKQQAVGLVKKFGSEGLAKFAKMHFKTASEAIEIANGS